MLRLLLRPRSACCLPLVTKGPVDLQGSPAAAIWRTRHYSSSPSLNSHGMVSTMGIRPKILVVNHGYPPDFSGGSEVYAQMMALSLLKSGQCESVNVFSREHDPFRPDFEVRKTSDSINQDLPVFLMNYPREAPYFRFLAEPVDAAFKSVLEEVKPDIVHLHHMNHLSLSLPAVAKKFGAKVVYTLHDFWLMCPRGQFLVTGVASGEAMGKAGGEEPWKQCDGQGDQKCARQCYVGRYGTGAAGRHLSATAQVSGEAEAAARSVDEEEYWTQWIKTRMQAARQACTEIDTFIAPSKYLLAKFVDEFQLPRERIIYEPYGFDRTRLAGRRRMWQEGAPFVFAYIGRHQPAKGVNLIVQAALQLLAEHTFSSAPSAALTASPLVDGGISRETREAPPFKVLIFGRQDANATRALKRMIEDSALPAAQDVFVWESEYNNVDIVRTVFDRTDCIIVPSIWEENSPLVIQEALQCRVPVITSEHGGMGELIKNAVNGLTFKHRSAAALAGTMRKALEQPRGLQHLAQRGDLRSEDGQVPCSEEHFRTLFHLYSQLLTSPTPAAAAAAVTSAASSRAEGPRAGAEVDAAAREETLNSRSAGPETVHLVPQQLEHLPAPWRVTFDTNPDDCNFSCTMCEQHSEHSPHQKERKARKERRKRMDFRVIEETVRELAPRGLREIIPTTMGEPLMYKHFPQFIDLCHTHGVKLNLTTNGSFHGRGVEEWARLIVPVGSDVKISWNGITQSTQEKIMKGSNLQKQIANLKNFIRIRNEVAADGGNYCSVTLQLTFMEVNLAEIPDLVRFAIETGCDRVKGHHLWAHFDEIKSENLRRSVASIGRWNAVASECRAIVAASANDASTLLPNGKHLRLENFFDLEPSAALDFAAELVSGGGVSAVGVGAAASRVRDGVDVPANAHPSAATAPDPEQAPVPVQAPAVSAIHPAAVCPFLGKEAWINHSGRFDPCCAPDLQRAALGSFGTVQVGENKTSSGSNPADHLHKNERKATGILDIWNSAEYKHLVHNYLENSLCQGCNMRQPPPSQS